MGPSMTDWAQWEELQGSRADVFWASPSPGSLDQPWAEDFSPPFWSGPQASLWAQEMRWSRAEGASVGPSPASASGDWEAGV